MEAHFGRNDQTRQGRRRNDGRLSVVVGHHAGDALRDRYGGENTIFGGYWRETLPQRADARPAQNGRKIDPCGGCSVWRFYQLRRRGTEGHQAGNRGSFQRLGLSGGHGYESGSWPGESRFAFRRDDGPGWRYCKLGDAWIASGVAQKTDSCRPIGLFPPVLVYCDHEKVGKTGFGGAADLFYSLAVGPLIMDFHGVAKSFDEAVAAGVCPGAVVLVGKDDDVVYEQAFGNRSLLPNKTPMRLDTIFDLASLTKPLATAVAIMLLIRERKLRFDDQLTRIIPMYGVLGKSPTTFRHLLNHSAGLPAWKAFFEDIIKNEKSGRINFIASRAAKNYVYEQIHR